MRDALRQLGSWDVSVREAEGLVAWCRGVPDTLTRAWQSVADALADTGMEAGDCRRACEDLLAAIDASLDVMAGVYARADATALRGGTVGGLEGLQDAVAGVHALKAKVAEVHEWASRPPAPVDRRMLAESQAAYERGESEDLADIVARLQAGGEL
jgi:hypothetical protein